MGGFGAGPGVPASDQNGGTSAECRNVDRSAYRVLLTWLLSTGMPDAASRLAISRALSGDCS